MEISFKKSLQEIDLSFDKYKEFADRIYKKEPINKEQIDKILSYYNKFERFDETNLVQSTLDTENKIEEIKTIVDKQIYETCSTQIKTIKSLSNNKIQIRFQVNHLKNEYDKCIRILLILLRNKIALITTNEPLKPNNKIVHNQELQEMQRLQDKFNQVSSDRRFAIRKQQEYDRIMAQKIHDQQLAEQLHKEERDAIFNKQQQQQDRDLALAYYYKDRPFASAITRLTRKQKPKHKRKTLIKPKKKTPKEDKKLKKLVKKRTQAKKRKKQRKEQDTKKKNRIQKKRTGYRNRQQ